MELLSQSESLSGSIGLDTSAPAAGQIDRLLRQVGEGFKDLRPAYRRIAVEVLLPALVAAFQTGSSPDGSRWEGLSADYLKRKGEGRALVRTGALEDALTRGGGGGGAIRRFGKTSSMVGTSLGYGLPLQWGYGTGHSGTARARAMAAASGREHRSRSKGLRSVIPARSFIAWSGQMTDDAADILVEALLDMIEASARGGTA